MEKSLLIIFVKNPKLGRAKTRLAATIGEKSALNIYKRLLEKTRDVAAPLPSHKVVFYDQFIDRSDLWPNKDFEKNKQTEGHLGEKMEAAFQWAFDSGYEQICIIGSDCYDLTTERLMEAFECLSKNDAVIGPSKDGGYYLLGLKKLSREIFHNKRWSTNTVGSDTERDFKSLGLKYSKLEMLNDIDTEDDLGEWANDLILS